MPVDGNDMASLLSMTDMPRGVPVLTVGVNKVCSLLLLSRILPEKPPQDIQDLCVPDVEDVHVVQPLTHDRQYR